MIDLNCIIPYNPGQPSARRSRTPGKRFWSPNLPQPGSTQDNAIELSDAPISDDSSIPESVETTSGLGSSKATPPLEPIANSITDPFDEVGQSGQSDLQFQGSTGKASLSDDDCLDIDDVFSITGKNGVESALSQSIHAHDLELSHSEDNPSDHIRYASQSSGTSHDISNTEQFTKRAILESLAEPTNDDGCANSQVNSTKTVLQLQQEPEQVLGGQSEYSRLLPLEPVATEKKEHTPGHGTGGEPEERISNKKPSIRRARSPSTSPEPIKRRRWHLRTCSRIESEAEDASDAHHKTSRKRTRIGKKSTVGSQSATVLDGDWLIDGIVGERCGAKGKEFMVQWRPTWVYARDVNAEHCKQQWRIQKRRMKTCGSRG